MISYAITKRVDTLRGGYAVHTDLSPVNTWAARFHILSENNQDMVVEVISELYFVIWQRPYASPVIVQNATASYTAKTNNGRMRQLLPQWRNRKSAWWRKCQKCEWTDQQTAYEKHRANDVDKGDWLAMSTLNRMGTRNDLIHKFDWRNSEISYNYVQCLQCYKMRRPELWVVCALLPDQSACV